MKNGPIIIPNPERHYTTYYRSTHQPWVNSLGMVRISPHSWYIGNDWVGVALIETTEGLILIDSGIKGQMYLIFESVRKLGYDPEKDIKLCLISHAHADHISGAALLKNYSNPIMYMSEIEKTWPMEPNKSSYCPRYVDIVEPFEADRFYDYSKPIVFGNMKIQPVLTAGHTPGTTSFFFEDTDDEGNVYKVGLHGGMGTNTMEDHFFDSAEDAWAERAAFRKNLEAIMDMEVDITATNHAGNIWMEDRMGGDKNDFRPFIDKSIWRRHIQVALDRLDIVEANTIFKK